MNTLATPPTTTATESIPAATPPPPPKTRILMVDDEAAFTNMVKRALEATDRFEVQTENFALSAVSVARKFRPDLVLLDVIMPMTDGGTVAAQFKADPKLRDLPLIFLTAAISRRESGDRAINQGGETFLAKPVELATLILHIDSKLKSSSAARSGQHPTRNP